MAHTPPRYSRRRFLASAAGMSLAGGLAPAASAVYTKPAALRFDGREPIAVLGTVYRPLSCMYHLAGRFLHGWPEDSHLHIPSQYVSTLWVEQAPENDVSRTLAREFHFRKTRTIHEALIDDHRLAVRGVMIIAEHGNYPRNDMGQVLYPKFDIFAQVVAAFHEVGQVCPVYVARHLSHDFDKAKQMVAWSQQMSFSLLAGSPVPFAQRSGDLEITPDADVEEVLVAAFGPVEVGGFDALEALQSIIEQRNGGETGVSAVTCLTGKEVWRAGDTEQWRWDLLDAALAQSTSANLGDVRVNTGSMAVSGMPATPPIAFLIEYVDGSRGTVLLLNGHTQDVTAAVGFKNTDQIKSGRYELLPLPGLRHYDRLAASLEQFFASGQAPSPVERNLLTTSVLTAAMQSHAYRGTRIETPQCNVNYRFTI